MAIPRASALTEVLKSQEHGDRWGFSQYGQEGSEIFRMGDIGGRAWGGAGDVLPEGTVGIWGTRDGVWLKSYVVASYTNCATVEFESGNINPATNAIVLVTVVIDEVLPFDSVRLRSGRAITLDYKPYSASLVINLGSPETATRVALTAVEIRADLDGGGIASYAYLTGPETPGLREYTDVSIRTTWQAEFAAFNWNSDATYTLTRNAVIRLLGHEVNSAPAPEHVDLDVFTAGTIENGREFEGGGGDPGGGSGSEGGGYEGGGGGGNEA